MDYKPDYIFERKELKEWQKWFNQWKHDYKLEIIAQEIWDDDTVTILLRRTKLITKS